MLAKMSSSLKKLVSRRQGTHLVWSQIKNKLWNIWRSQKRDIHKHKYRNRLPTSNRQCNKWTYLPRCFPGLQACNLLSETGQWDRQLQPMEYGWRITLVDCTVNGISLEELNYQEDIATSCSFLIIIVIRGNMIGQRAIIIIKPFLNIYAIIDSLEW